MIILNGLKLLKEISKIETQIKDLEKKIKDQRINLDNEKLLTEILNEKLM